MKGRTLGGLWFLGLWLFIPWPLVVFSDAYVPAVRYLLLGVVAALVAATEGASGPVGMIVVLLLGYGIATTLACGLAAWILSKLIVRLPPRIATALTLAFLAGGLLVGLLFTPYRTPFGRALRGGLLQVLS